MVSDQCYEYDQMITSIHEIYASSIVTKVLKQLCNSCILHCFYLYFLIESIFSYVSQVAHLFALAF